MASFLSRSTDRPGQWSDTPFDRIDPLAAGGDRDLNAGDRYTTQELLATGYAEPLRPGHLGIDDAFFARLALSFTDAEILDLTICLAAFVGPGRMLRSLGIDEMSLLDA